MDDPGPYILPSISDDDVAWACEVLNLPRTAFSGADGSDPRLEVLKSTATLDVEACPGSGKTTLLVAKLAILARHWTSRRQGICVLSHTNAARREIEERLGNTKEGRRLLSYPHFIGTIHNFINEFVAIPWLRSLGYPIKYIDDHECEKHRRRLLGLTKFSTLKTHVENKENNQKADVNIVKFWHVSTPEFGVVKDKGKPAFKDPTGPAARQLCALAKTCVGDGYYRFDEMFMWAHDLLSKAPDAAQGIRHRFPVLLIDEVQDNGHRQSSILSRLFMENSSRVTRQRFGDSNQAIYGYAGASDAATTDTFPHTAVCRDIPNSHRFGQEIANLARPMALTPPNLVGAGPPKNTITTDTSGKHAIFLFDDQTAKHVLETYAEYLTELFSDQERHEGVYTAVGGTHRLGDDTKLPRAVKHYWSEYDHELTSTEPRPGTFAQYLAAGRGRASLSGESHPLVEKIAEAILRLAHLANPSSDIGSRSRKHRNILDLLADKPEARAAYLELLTTLAVERKEPSAEEWNSKWVNLIGDIARSIGGVSQLSEEAKAFVAWQAVTTQDQQSQAARRRDNIFRHPSDNPKVSIRVGSIHSVKGETHTATLVLETYSYEHHLLTLKPWLLGQKSGKAAKEQTRNIIRLKQHYVAMTRPTHLLCLAMRRDALTDQEIATLKGRSWRVGQVSNAAVQWL